MFQSGNIIITGAKNESQIIDSYNYITELLKENKEKIQKKELKSIFDDEEFSELLITPVTKSDKKKISVKTI